MVQVVLENLTKYFGKVLAVDNVSLKVEDKEFLTLLGPSGCGKTTTLRLVGGLEVPTSGNIYIGDRLVNDVDPKDRNVAMVFQTYALYPHMTVFDNIAFPLKLRKVPKDEVKERVKRVAELLQIGELLDRKPKELSGGQRQRTALGRAIIREPSVFLMDEPLSNLDAKLRVYMRAELVALQKKLETTLIYVTHDQLEAMTMSDRIVAMNDGKVQQIGDPNEVYRSPSNTWVAGFFGSPPMNFLDGTLIDVKGKPVVDFGFYKFGPNDLTEAAKKGATGPEVILGVRPEDISLSRERSPDSFEASIYVVEPVGDSTIIDLTVDGQILKATVRGMYRAKIGEKLYLTPSAKESHIFDKKITNLIA